MASAIDRFGGHPARSMTAGFGAIAVAAPPAEADLFQDERQIVAIWGRVRYTDAALAELAQHHGVARALAEGFARKRADVFAAMSGSFALAILDSRSGEAVLAIDRMGVRPLCYSTGGGELLFGTTLNAIDAFPGAQSRVSAQAIYDYLYFHMVPGPQTIHANRCRLLPGTYLKWRNSAAETHSYWQMRYVEEERLAFPELKERFVALLREGVREAAASEPVGAFLSGGTDSSTIAGVLGQITGEPARTYSIGFEARGYDEMEFARIAARYFGTRHHEYYVTPDDVVNGIPMIAAVHDQPFGNSSAVPTYYCAKLARQDGVQALLGGDGGDELFGGNSRYATQHIYALYGDLPRVVRKGLIEPIAFLPPEIGIVGKVQRYIRHASLPMPARYDNYNLLERLGAETIFTAQFLQGVDRGLPARQVAETYAATSARTLVNRMLGLDLKYTLADNDLPKVSRSCELAGVDVRFPLLNDALVAFSARLPARLKLKGTRLRYFFKEALRDLLPPEIITKTKHGFGLPFGPWLQTHPSLRQIALDSLASLKRRDIVRPEFIDELTSVHVKSHADYYGTMVWLLMMLEQWLKEHRPVV